MDCRRLVLAACNAGGICTCHDESITGASASGASLGLKSITLCPPGVVTVSLSSGSSGYGLYSNPCRLRVGRDAERFRPTGFAGVFSFNAVGICTSCAWKVGQVAITSAAGCSNSNTFGLNTQTSLPLGVVTSSFSTPPQSAMLASPVSILRIGIDCRRLDLDEALDQPALDPLIHDPSLNFLARGSEGTCKRQLGSMPGISALESSLGLKSRPPSDVSTRWFTSGLSKFGVPPSPCRFRAGKDAERRRWPGSNGAGCCIAAGICTSCAENVGQMAITSVAGCSNSNTFGLNIHSSLPLGVVTTSFSS
mmetsp:Transcript_39339/g.65339  ORF Transcript_39339/g.65339 Transcript_39339/m.65339 type:complete len:308 (+) Transcript_39339:318-1241(+)